MLKIEKFVTPSPEQWEITIEGMRNAMNSWDKMDSEFGLYCDDMPCDGCPAKDCNDCTKKLHYHFSHVNIGPNDHDLMMRLNKGGAPHAKYRRMLPVHVTVNAPLYWWKEFETYRVGVASNPSDIEFNSCSTMHRIHAKEFTLEDFSTEHLISDWIDEHVDTFAHIYTGDTIETNDDVYDDFIMKSPLETLKITIDVLNRCRQKFLETKNKDYWYTMIQLLPSSYNQKRTIYLNYQVLYEIYEWRRNHKLDEWHTFCHWIEELPYSELIIGEKE